jgi:hypothetical protein
MSDELETATLASMGGWLRWKRKHADIPVGTPCANCETPLQGTYCHVCGQLAEDFHRSTWHLLVEAIESLLHLDGRLFHTLPRLIRRPGELTRDYLAGKRAWQVQPFRMFLVILLVVLFVNHLASKGDGSHKSDLVAHDAPPAAAGSALVHGPDTPEARADVEKARADIESDPDLTPAQRAAGLAAVEGDWAAFGQSMVAQGSAKAGADGHVIETRLAGGDRTEAFRHWVEVRVQAVRDDPERFALIMEIWLHRIAILALPVSAAMLSLLFAFNRRFFVFDHLIFSMHSLSFQMLLVTVILLLSIVIGGWAWWLVLVMPVHLFVHMKGAYQRSAFGTVVRMGTLCVLTTVTFSLLGLLWLYLAFNQMAGH